MTTDRVRYVVWVTGLVGWYYGLIDRAIAAFTNDFSFATNLGLLAIGGVLTTGWLILKPSK